MLSACCACACASLHVMSRDTGAPAAGRGDGGGGHCGWELASGHFFHITILQYHEGSVMLEIDDLLL